ncbi:ATP-binding cassette domain-containing protein [PVC group bacterium]|nr:ATP-binding cassette domain-containing protein [PVC group bacterium]
MIDIKKVSMRYGPVKALVNVSFSVKKGEILGLLGPNGAGKSTLMKVLTTFIYPSGGTAIMGGFDVLHEALKVRELVGYLPEAVPLYMDMRVDDYLNFIGKARGLKGIELKKRIGWVKERCAINSVWKHTCLELSKGFQQRVGLAQALIHNPDILILDEPTSGLDPLQIVEIRKLIKELAYEKTIIFSTHILQEVDAIADRIVIINNGTIISSGTREELGQKALRYRTHVLCVQENHETVKQALSGLRNAKDVKCTESSADGFSTFEIQSSFEQNEMWKEISQIIREKGWAVKSLIEKPYSLENTFISLLTENRSQSSQGS